MKKPLSPLSLYAAILAAILCLVFAAKPALEKMRAEQVVLEIPKTGELAVPIKDSGKEGIRPGGHVTARVAAVTDGDTIEVAYGKKDYKVRLLCMDTPESVKDGVERQPYSEEASEMTQRLVGGKQVKLVFDKALYDKYGRLLAFVMLENGECLNALLVYGGYARAEIVNPNKTYGEWFYKLQQAAVDDRSGMWALPEKQRPFVKNGSGGYIPRYLAEKAS